MKVLGIISVFFMCLLVQVNISQSYENGCSSSSCHPDVTDGEIIHEPVLEGNCTVCHVTTIDDSEHDCKEYSKSQSSEDSLKLCLNCKNVYGSVIYSANYWHEPVKNGDCLNCHNPHRSNHKALLVEDYFMGDYGGVSRIFEVEEFQLCWKCHPKELLTVEKTEKATQFRDGEMNLHYKHNSKDRSVSCRTCHALIHRSLKEKLFGPRYVQHQNALMSDSYWEYNIDKDGGTCIIPCHQGETYNRKK